MFSSSVRSALGGLARTSWIALTWRRVLFLHWPVSPQALRDHVPEELSLDTYDGTAWVSVVALHMADCRPPSLPAAFGYTFPEVNLRTYVTGDEPAVYFFSLDGDEPLGPRLAHGLLDVPYYRANVTITERDESFRVRSDRVDGPRPATVAASWRRSPGTALSRPDEESLPSFLAERYRFYLRGGAAPLPLSSNGTDAARSSNGTDAARTTDAARSTDTARSTDASLYTGTVAHDPWRLQPATVTVDENTLFDAAGLPDPTGGLVAYYCPERTAVAGRLRTASSPGRPP